MLGLVAENGFLAELLDGVLLAVRLLAGHFPHLGQVDFGVSLVGVIDAVQHVRGVSLLQHHHLHAHRSHLHIHLGAGPGFGDCDIHRAAAAGLAVFAGHVHFHFQHAFELGIRRQRRQQQCKQGGTDILTHRFSSLVFNVFQEFVPTHGYQTTRHTYLMGGNARKKNPVCSVYPSDTATKE